MALVAGHDGRLAAQVQRADQAGAVDDGDLGVVALVLGPAGDVLDACRRCSGRRRRTAGWLLPGQDAVLGVDA